MCRKFIAIFPPQTQTRMYGEDDAAIDMGIAQR